VNRSIRPGCPSIGCAIVRQAGRDDQQMSADSVRQARSPARPRTWRRIAASVLRNVENQPGAQVHPALRIHNVLGYRLPPGAG
jgi:hypothetical protein